MAQPPFVASITASQSIQGEISTVLCALIFAAWELLSLCAGRLGWAGRGGWGRGGCGILLGSACGGGTCPAEGARSPHLGAPHPGRQRPRNAVPSDVVWAQTFPRLENSSGALPLPSVCSGLSAGLQPSCCCADANVCPLIFPASVCTTEICSAPCSQHSFICPRILLRALACSWATSWPSDVSSPHAGVDASIFGSRQGLRSSLGSFLKLIRLYQEMAVLWIAHVAHQITRMSLPLFHRSP